MNTFRFNRIVAILLISAGAIGAADRKIVIVNADRYPWAVNSYFIAVSRGGLYDTPSLVKALDSRKLAGAGLDVTGPEPLPGQSPGSFERCVGVIRENLGRFVRGERMINVVDKQKGY